MVRSSLTVLVLVLVLGPQTATLSQDRGAENPAAPANQTGAMLVRFHDGTMMRLSLVASALDVTTKHGKLKIAVSDIRKIELATRIPEKAQTEISQAVRQLADPQVKVRDDAVQKLKSHRELAYADLLEAAASSDPEVKQRAVKLLDWLKEIVPAEKLRIRQKDTVHTEDSIIACKIEAQVIPVESAHFGKLEVRLADAASIMFVGNGAVTSLKLDGAHALSTEVWLDTQLDFLTGSHLTVEAQGEIDMYATGGYIGQYVGTPRGKKAWPGNTGLPYEPGTLIGRFGRNGKPFTIGGSYEGRVGDEGRLYLRAAGNPYNVQTSGEYTIRITGGATTR